MKKIIIFDTKPGQCKHEMWGVDHDRFHEIRETLKQLVHDLALGPPVKDPIATLFREGLKIAKNEKERLLLVWSLTNDIRNSESNLPDRLEEILSSLPGDTLKGIGSIEEGRFNIQMTDRKKIKE